MLSIIKKYPGSNFVTGLRAYAAIAVLLIHTGGAGLRSFGAVGNEIVNFCQNGVIAFFVISGFSVASSISSSQKFSEYFLSRLIRISPLYFFWIIFVFILNNNYSYYQIYNLVVHLTYLSFFDYKIANSLLGVEWSIPIEIFYYLLIPSLLIFIKKNNIALVFCFSALFFYIELHKLVDLIPLDSYKWIILKYSPVPYVLAFGLGVYAFIIRSNNKFSNLKSNLSILFALLLLFLYFFLPYFKQFFYDEYIFTCLLTFIVLAYSSDHSIMVKAFLNNRAILYLGTLSYGIYLCHFQIYYHLDLFYFGSNIQTPFEKFVLTLAYSIFISYVLLLILERPSIDFLKRRLIRKQ